MLNPQHNNHTLIDEIKAMTGPEISALVTAGHYNVTVLDRDPKRNYRDIPLDGEWVLSFYQSRDRTSPDWGHVRVTLHSKSPLNRKARQIGEQNYAELCGLSPDHAYNWRNSFISSRYRLLPALLAVSKDPDCLQYLSNPPSVEDLLNPIAFKKWITNNPSTDPDVITITQAEYPDFNRLIKATIRDRLTFEERHELREDHFERVAINDGVLNHRRNPVPPKREIKPHSAAPYPARDTEQRSSHGYANKHPRPTPVERMEHQNESFHRQDDEKYYWQRSGHATTEGPIQLDSAKPNYENRHKRKVKGRQREQSRSDNKWN